MSIGSAPFGLVNEQVEATPSGHAAGWRVDGRDSRRKDVRC